MFKKIFGPKKVGGVGTPIPAEELRASILTNFPIEDDINQYLTIEDSDDSPDGFNAVWKFYARDLDGEGIRRKYLITHTVKVNIQPQENAVYIKSKHFARTARVPDGETLHDSCIQHIQIGKIGALKATEKKKFRAFSQKKSIEPLVEHITQNGWDAYR